MYVLLNMIFALNPSYHTHTHTAHTTKAAERRAKDSRIVPGPDAGAKKGQRRIFLLIIIYLIFIIFNSNNK